MWPRCGLKIEGWQHGVPLLPTHLLLLFCLGSNKYNFYPVIIKSLMLSFCLIKNRWCFFPWEDYFTILIIVSLKGGSSLYTLQRQPHPVSTPGIQDCEKKKHSFCFTHLSGTQVKNLRDIFYSPSCFPYFSFNILAKD